MGWVIFVRNPNNKKLSFIRDAGDEDLIAEFASQSEADDAARTSALCAAWGYELVEVGT